MKKQSIVDLEKAMRIMLDAHTGQLDKGGHPYFLHPIRVMSGVATVDEKIVALLHDTVEDSSISLSFLKQEGFCDEIVDAVNALTKRDGEAYETFISRVMLCKLATRVKIVDLQDNLDVRRLKEITTNDLQRIQKYLTALSKLSQSKYVNGEFLS